MALTTSADARMFPWHAYPSPARPPAQSKHSAPVNDADRPAASTTPTWRCSRWASPSRSRSRTACGSSPSASRSRPRGPKVTSARAWVATAPTSPRAHGTTAPAARNFDWTATPASFASTSTATMENVIALQEAPELPQLREEPLVQRGPEVRRAARAARPGLRADLSFDHQDVPVPPHREQLVVGEEPLGQVPQVGVRLPVPGHGQQALAAD